MRAKIFGGILFGYCCAVLGACAQSVPCGTPTSLVPFVQMLYPEPNASDVPDSARTLVSNAGPSVPILLGAGSAPPVRLSSTAVPSPLPSPAASPLNAPREFAVALPALRAGTTYTVTASVREVGCGGDAPATAGLGSFTTE